MRRSTATSVTPIVTDELFGFGSGSTSAVEEAMVAVFVTFSTVPRGVTSMEA